MAYLEYANLYPEKTFEVYGQNLLGAEIPENVFFKDMVSNSEVLKILGKTKYFFCQPYWPEPSGRLAAEAFLSGCEMITNDRIGTCSFDFYPYDIERAKKEMKDAPENFWGEITVILRKTAELKQTQKILVHKTSGGLGDIFFCLPALYVLKKAYDQVAFAFEPRLVSFFQKHLDGIIILDESKTAAVEKDYDKVIELGNYPAYMGGFRLPHAIKYISHKKVGQHAINHYMDSAARLHVDADPHGTSYPYFKRQPDFQNPYYTLHPGAGLIIKAWSAKNFAVVINEIKKQFPILKCKMILGPDDPDPTDFLDDKSNVEFITGNIEEVGNAISGALFHIGNDSGITHIADAYNLPTLGIFGPTGPGAWGNFAQYHEIIWGKTGTCDLRCDYEVLKNCSDRVCLSSIKPQKVMGALYKLLQKCYPEILKSQIINPDAEIIIENAGCSLKIDGNEFDIQFTNKEVKRNVIQILSGNFEINNEEMLSFLEFLKAQFIVLSVPDFNTVWKQEVAV